MSRRPIPVLIAAAAAVAAAACGDGEMPPAAAAPTAEPAATPAATTTAVPVATPARTARPGTRVRVVPSQFGRIAGAERGLAVYIFDKEERERSECYGACARAWPPVLAKGRPVAGKGIDRDLLGTTRRRNGKRQVTYRGQPLYYYEHDQPGLVLCHDVVEFGGTWLVIRPDGRPVP